MGDLSFWQNIHPWIQGRAYAANYGGSTLSVISLTEDGRLGELEMVESYGEGCRDASHPHQTVSKDSWVWVVDLGCDTIWHYRETVPAST